MNEWASTEVAALQASWLLSLRARNLAAKTLRTYGDALAGLVAHSGATALDDLTRHAVRAYLADQGEQHKAATVSVRFRALQQFFKWLQEEGEVEASPMQGLRAPVVPEEPVPPASTASHAASAFKRQRSRTCGATAVESSRATRARFKRTVQTTRCAPQCGR